MAPPFLCGICELDWCDPARLVSSVGVVVNPACFDQSTGSGREQFTADDAVKSAIYLAGCICWNPGLLIAIAGRTTAACHALFARTCSLGFSPHPVGQLRGQVSLCAVNYCND
jgi:hypothetical protein